MCDVCWDLHRDGNLDSVIGEEDEEVVVEEIPKRLVGVVTSQCLQVITQSRENEGEKSQYAMGEIFTNNEHTYRGLDIKKDAGLQI